MVRASTNTKGHVVRTIAAIIFALIGIAGSVQLLRVKIIGEASFVSLIVIVLLIGFVIAFIDRIAWIGSPWLKVQMARVEEARKEVEAIEDRVTEIARIVSEVTDWNISKHGLFFGSARVEENKEWLTQKNEELKALVRKGSPTKRGRQRG